MVDQETSPLAQVYLNRELAWLTFARRVLALAEDPDTPLMERVKFAAIMGMLYDEFAMKRLGGMLKKLGQGQTRSHAPDGMETTETLRQCRVEVESQHRLLNTLIESDLRPGLARIGYPLLGYTELDDANKQACDDYFARHIEPILTPLAVDLAHPFPFVSNQSLNIAALIKDTPDAAVRFVRIKVPDNRPRWVPLPDGGWVPLEDLITNSVKLLFPLAAQIECHYFRVLRGAKDSPWDRPETHELDPYVRPGRLMDIVADELEDRKYAGVTRLEVDAAMPEFWATWLARCMGADEDVIGHIDGLMATYDLADLKVDRAPELFDPPYEPVTHPRLQSLPDDTAAAFFAEIRRGDLLVHFPYQSFDTSVLKMLKLAATDPTVLAIKLTIYRTAKDSPVIEALAEAARRGKQVAVLVELTARFDETPNIAWARYLEKMGAHVAYGVEKLKTHAKLALIVREEADGLRRYVHFGTGNYHSGTARLYEDLGVVSCDEALGLEVEALFNELTSATPRSDYERILVAPHTLRRRFTELITREMEHAGQGLPCGIHAKFNQLQDPEIIQALCDASQAGVPITLNVRGFCCLSPGVEGISENVRVYSVLGRYLEHSRIYRFENDGQPEYFIGSADWMKRNLDRRVEAITQVRDDNICRELDAILDTHDQDNASAWDMQPDGQYVRRQPPGDGARYTAQDEFMSRAKAHGKSSSIFSDIDKKKL
ncbi:polyphosphate kinase 1 [Pseudomonadota bacterium]